MTQHKLQPMLQVTSLSVGFQTRQGLLHAVDNVSFALPAGGSLAIVGESGCGKSALSLAIMGLLPGNGRRLGGQMYLDGVDITTQSPVQWRQIRGKKVALIFQDPMTSLNPWMRIGQQVVEQIRVHRADTKAQAWQRTLDLLTSVGLPDPERIAQSYPHQISGGQRQRILIAMALSCDPDIIIADEPTTALDVTVQAQVLALIRREQRQRGMGLVLITHNLGVARGMCDNVAVMYAGRIVEMGPTVQLFQQPLHPYTQGLLAALPRLDQPREQALTAIPGQPPKRMHLEPGCPFADRCPRVEPNCRQHNPADFTVNDAHVVACDVVAREVAS